MATQFINGTAVSLPQVIFSGNELDSRAINILNEIHLTRLKSRLRWLHKKGKVKTSQLQAKAQELAREPLSPLTLEEASNPINSEALLLARELIEKSFAKNPQDLPKNLDAFAQKVVDATPGLMEKARQRIEKKIALAKSSLNQVEKDLM